MNEELKKSLIEMVKDMGLDIDGDIIFYNGKRYYIDVLNNEVVEV